MRILPMITLGAGLTLIGGTAIGIDYTMQSQRADGAFDTRAYVDGLFDRFGNNGGILGLMFRDSVAIDFAMPEPPAGWDAWYVDDSHLHAVFSEDQMKVNDAEWAKIDAQVPEMQQLSDADVELLWAYYDDTSTAYTNGADIILLYVSDDANAVNQPVIRKFLDLADAHFATLETRQDWRSFNDQLWQEIEDPVTRADNGWRPHKLRMFETEMGTVTLYLEARASEKGLEQFLEGFDISGLRNLGNANTPDDAQLSAQVSSLQTETSD